MLNSRSNFAMARLLFVLVGGILTVMVVPVLVAQDNDKVIRIDTQLAVFEVLVEDKNGKPVHGLKAKDFRIYENGKEQDISFFQPVLSGEKHRPMTIVLAVDVSGSMTPDEIEKLRSAIISFVDRFGDHRSYFSLVSFAMDVNTLQKFTNRPDVIKKSLKKLDRDQDGRSTHAYDAVDTAVRSIERSSPKSIRGEATKRAVVVITDGFPVGDTVSPETVIERANRSGISIYSIILPSYSPLQRGSKPLMTLLEASGLVDKTGGSSLYAIDNDLEPLFKKLAEEISASYAIAFYPKEKASTGNEKRSVLIESRQGYRLKQNRTTYELKE